MTSNHAHVGGVSYRGVRSPWLWLGLAVLVWLAVELVPRFSGRSPEDYLVSAQGVSASGEGDYLFFTFRRSLWRIQKSTAVVQFFNFPESTERDQQIQSSRLHTFDIEEFPLDQVLFQVSERNLTNYLWVTNPVTGRARFIKARRDGIIDASPILGE